MAAIDMKNIVKKYGDGFPAVNDVSIDVTDGEFMILVGPSGCGKSTLLRMIVGLEDITSGDMMIGDRKVNDLAPRDRNLAMVFQNYALYPHLTVYENIAFPLRLAGASDEEVDKKVREASKTLELDEHLERKPGNLSGGQRQRVAMGRAIVREADAFLFDEPLSNLDAKLRGQMRTEISRLQKRLGITTVYVTHDQTEAMTLGDRVAVLKRGVLQQLATPRELYENPGNLFVAGFIGSPPMNFLPATVEGDTIKLPVGEMKLPEEKAKVAAGKGLLIAGIRPEHFDDASVVDTDKTGHTFSATVDVVEWLGNEAYAYIPFEAPPEVQSQLDQLERDLDGEGMRTQLVVSLDGASRIAEGDQAEIWLDTSKIHLFDPGTGENLTIDAERAGRVPAMEDPEAIRRAEEEAAKGEQQRAETQGAADA
jgi:multiple sugar transport system ATP-binding protein